jgi:hypothetical protein
MAKGYMHSDLPNVIDKIAFYWCVLKLKELWKKEFNVVPSVMVNYLLNHLIRTAGINFNEAEELDRRRASAFIGLLPNIRIMSNHTGIIVLRFAYRFPRLE